MDDTVNTSTDAACYDSCSYARGRSLLTDANLLYEGFRRSRKGSAWKAQVQQFEMNFLSEIADLQQELRDGSYTLSKPTVFTIQERGKTRVITGENIRDRTVKHVLCDNILLPAIRPKLIHDNGASLKGKGVDFTRKRLITHLCRYYREHGNSGYVLLMDYSKFYDNIRHDLLRQILLSDVEDGTAEKLIRQILFRERVDVSWLSDEEYLRCLDTLFDSLQYQAIPSRLKTGQKYMDKHMDIGDQLAQIAGISYPMAIDNYVKIVRGIRYYARYMDDSYVIHPDKGYLRELQADLTERAAAMGITINQRKTMICRVSDRWRFLQIQYSLTDSGRIVQKINPRGLTRMRRKLKKLAPVMTPEAFALYFDSWYLSLKKYMSHRQAHNLMELCHKLKEENRCIQSSLETDPS